MKKIFNELSKDVNFDEIYDRIEHFVLIIKLYINFCQDCTKNIRIWILFYLNIILVY